MEVGFIYEHIWKRAYIEALFHKFTFTEVGFRIFAYTISNFHKCTFTEVASFCKYTYTKVSFYKCTFYTFMEVSSVYVHLLKLASISVHIQKG
jgi:hypothetical protein